MTLPLRLLFLALAAACVLSGCNRDEQVIVPNRVLDRPLDVALACVRLNSDGQVEALSLNTCASGAAPTCSSTDSPQLVGFVANSEKNEVGLFRRCDREAGMVDLDPEAPGYQLVPVGTLPSRIAATELGCNVVTANVGSCDLSVIDGRDLAAYALGTPPSAAPSELVATIVPRLSDGEPLATRPGDLMTVPSRLSLAQPLSEADPEEPEGTTTGGGEPEPLPTDGDDDGSSLDPGALTLCPDRADSVYVTFPDCQLVAEVSLTSQRILQSRRFVTLGDGTVVVEDAGTNPVCPVDCAGQFDGVVPDRDVDVDPNGFFPTSVSLVEPVDPEARIDEADDEITYSALYVGGLGSDRIFEIQFQRGANGEENGIWAPPEQTRSLLLEQAAGVHDIEPTPAVQMADGPHQFLYVIAGDGSTRVVDRDFDDDQLGVECDTQIDPSLVSAPYPSCNPIDPNAAGNTPDRRPFALGPGIRASGGAAINDWAFQKLSAEQAAELRGEDEAEIAQSGPIRAPFLFGGVVGIGVTSFGRVVFSTFNQYQNAEPVNPSIDPVGIMNLAVPPHSLWPLTDPTIANPPIEALPRVEDEEPGRALPGAEDTTQVLAPSLRQIDFAYSAPPANVDVSQNRQQVAANLGNPGNVDALGQFDGEGLYENPVARVVARDYKAWGTAVWDLIWEGSIPGTRSPAGRLQCESPGWEGGTCAVQGGSEDHEDDIVLYDESATFCDNGVLAGDKLVILGCTDDSDCGLGQRCLREPTAPGNASGICISALAYESEFELLRTVCAPFIDDPCGDPQREYLISRAFQDRLYLQALNIPATAHLRAELDEDGEPLEDGELFEVVDRFTCRLPPALDNGQIVACSADEDCDGLGEDFVCSNDGLCRGACPGGVPECLECLEDSECGHFGDGAICSNNRCRRPCEPGDPDCLLAPLPGPRCFAELTDYVVRVRNSFLVQGDPSPTFLADQVYADPETGECLEDPTVSNLLTSRLRLGEDEAATFNDPFIGIPDCPNADEAAPSDPNPCRVTVARDNDPGSLFHYFSYQQEPVSAVRFSNPLLSFVLDLTSLSDLASGSEAFERSWPVGFTDFQRARIPRNYRQSFATLTGYTPYSEVLLVGNTPMVYPVQIVDGEGLGIAYVVDAGGRGGVTGVRGQVIRINAAAASIGPMADESFRVR